MRLVCAAAQHATGSRPGHGPVLLYDIAADQGCDVTVDLLRQARHVGFTLDECQELVALFHNPERHSADVKARTLEKAAEIGRHIEELTEMRQRLLALAESCPGDEGAECPIINNLTGCCSAQPSA